MVILDIGYFTLLEISDICPVRVLTTVTKWCSCIYISYRRRLKNKSNLGYELKNVAQRSLSSDLIANTERAHQILVSCLHFIAFQDFPPLQFVKMVSYRYS